MYVYMLVGAARALATFVHSHKASITIILCWCYMLNMEVSPPGSGVIPDDCWTMRELKLDAYHTINFKYVLTSTMKTIEKKYFSANTKKKIL
jgi:hypothetical protein